MDNLRLVEISNEIQSFCVNAKTDRRGFVYHALPLINQDKHYLSPENWDLDKKFIEEIQRKRELLGEYASEMVKKYYSFDFEAAQPEEQLLPPWIVFPLYHSHSLGWRMGTGEVYESLFLKFFVSMPNEAREEYKKTYSVPEYMEERYGIWYKASPKD